MPKSSASAIAAEIKAAADKYGFTVRVDRGIMRVSKNFPAGNVDAFRDCDMSYYLVLGILPRTQPGSDWGTDGGGIGGMVALNSGFFEMKRSGGSKRVLAALAKIL
jgi:hypothetical protein